MANETEDQLAALVIDQGKRIKELEAHSNSLAEQLESAVECVGVLELREKGLAVSDPELLTRCAEKLGLAILEVDRLREENSRLRTVISGDPERDALWMALSRAACKCHLEDEPGVFVLPDDHDSNCPYRDVYKGIKEAVAR